MSLDQNLTRKALRPTWAEVDLDAIAHNVRALKGAADPAAKFMAVVKADAYGHGAYPVARAALESGSDWLGAAILEEGLGLRKNGFACPVLVMGYVPPEVAFEAVVADLRVACYQMDLAEALSRAAARHELPAKVHVKVDTGMGRIGLDPGETIEFIRRISDLPGVEVEGLFTHFAASDEADKTCTHRQAGRFKDLCRALAAEGLLPPIRHAANSGAIIDLPEYSFNLVRAGIALYGLPPSPDVSDRAVIRAAMSWKARLSHVKTVPAGTKISYGCTFETARTSVIATLPVGYADGYARRWSNRGWILARGRRVPVIGRVCMDQFMVDLTDLPEADRISHGEEVVLIGRQDGLSITMDDWARELGTINYEIACLVGRRVPRVYTSGGRIVEVRAPMV